MTRYYCPLSVIWMTNETTNFHKSRKEIDIFSRETTYVQGTAGKRNNYCCITVWRATIKTVLSAGGEMARWEQINRPEPAEPHWLRFYGQVLNLGLPLTAYYDHRPLPLLPPTPPQPFQADRPMETSLWTRSFVHTGLYLKLYICMYTMCI